MKLSNFYSILEKSLPKSTGIERIYWAQQIVENKIDIKKLANLLFCTEPIATRFLWLLSDIAQLNPTYLFKELPNLLSLRNNISHLSTEASFANYWLICGVPIENEAEAISLLFNWLNSPYTNITTKSRALFVLFNLTKKHPDLKNELIISIQNQMDKYSADFNKRALKVLKKLQN